MLRGEGNKNKNRCYPVRDRAIYLASRVDVLRCLLSGGSLGGSSCAVSGSSSAVGGSDYRVSGSYGLYRVNLSGVGSLSLFAGTAGEEGCAESNSEN